MESQQITDPETSLDNYVNVLAHCVLEGEISFVEARRLMINYETWQATEQPETLPVW